MRIVATLAALLVAAPAMGAEPIYDGVIYRGATSGQATLTAPAVAGTPTITLPTVSGALPVTAGVNAWSAAQRATPVTLTDGATITPDFATGNNFAVTLGGNRTLANPTNVVAGQSGQVQVTQDATGSRTLAFGTLYKFPGGTAPTLTTTASAKDILSYYVGASGNINVSVQFDFR